ncbi:23110_t:CDS:2 [Cetraspora pellucida]|uniref:23110_t:CDS:1 n=1 Tax=Cetraspora pellucida TaxID=1433469 RepID=A0A9N8VF55_9GLOM|nr:23110_t:CDS:2 [Cetraspora pellucida]
MSQALDRFTLATKQVITEQFAKAKQELQTEDEDCYLDLILLIIEWNEQNLQRRGILKATVANQIQGFIGVSPLQVINQNLNVGIVNAGIPSNTIFHLIDIPPVEKQQVASDITTFLRSNYWQGTSNELEMFI